MHAVDRVSEERGWPGEPERSLAASGDRGGEDLFAREVRERHVAVRVRLSDAQPQTVGVQRDAQVGARRAQAQLPEAGLREEVGAGDELGEVALVRVRRVVRPDPHEGEDVVGQPTQRCIAELGVDLSGPALGRVEDARPAQRAGRERPAVGGMHLAHALRPGRDASVRETFEVVGILAAGDGDEAAVGADRSARAHALPGADVRDVLVRSALDVGPGDGGIEVVDVDEPRAPVVGRTGQRGGERALLRLRVDQRSGHPAGRADRDR